MRFETSTITNRGGRDNNEDSLRYYYQSGPEGCWVVADGLGGHAAGEVASAIATEAIVERFCRNPLLSADNIRECFREALNRILSRQETEPRLKSMRTTAVALFTDGESLMWAHTGDSRLYYFRSGKLLFQTKDHSVSQACANAGEITQDQIRFHEDRGRLLKVLGTDENLKVELSAPLHPERGDAFLLCTDGFWEYVLESEMETDLGNADSPRDWLNRMVQRLLCRAGEDNDNYSAAAVFIR